jgi:hypothetical protein
MPAAHKIAAETSMFEPPQRPNARIGRIFAL